MSDAARVEWLERELAARDRTIDILCDSVENRFDSTAGDLGLAVEMARLEDSVRQRTRELDAQKTALEDALLHLRSAQMQLVQAQKLEAIGQLAAGIAHEINTPMQYIGDNARFLEKAFAELLAVVSDAKIAELDARSQKRIGMLRERIPRALTSTCDGVDAVSKIVRAMKEFSHPGTGDKASFDLNAAIRSTLAVSRNEWKYIATVDLALDEGLPMAFGFQREVAQVLLNILVNASHAVADLHGHPADGVLRGKIDVTTRVGKAGLVIEIRDNGPGIPSAIRNRIFEPFFTTKPVGKGTGQGLAIARSIIVDQHQGSIDIESDDRPGSPTRGTSFVITLPVPV